MTVRQRLLRAASEANKEVAVRRSRERLLRRSHDTGSPLQSRSQEGRGGLIQVFGRKDSRPTQHALRFLPRAAHLGQLSGRRPTPAGTDRAAPLPRSVRRGGASGSRIARVHGRRTRLSEDGPPRGRRSHRCRSAIAAPAPRAIGATAQRRHGCGRVEADRGRSVGNRARPVERGIVERGKGLQLLVGRAQRDQ